jgi:hypothetical protein
MRLSVLFVAAACLVGLCVFTGPQAQAQKSGKKKDEGPNPNFKWEEVMSKDYGFTANFPGKPKEKSTKNKAGDETFHSWTSGFARNVVTYKVSISSVRYGTPEEIKKSKEATIKNWDKDFNIKSKKDITLGDHPGLELEGWSFIEGKTRAEMKAHFYWANGRRYDVHVIGPKSGLSDPADIAKFLDSFKLVGEEEKKK